MQSPNVDDWDEHWTEFREANERNPAQNFRQRLALQRIAGISAPRRLLDIGSGNGTFIDLAAARWPTAELLGLELSPAGVAQASQRVPRARFEVRNLMEERATGSDQNWATHAVCSEVLEHVDDPVTVLRNARSWMAPGCRLLITLPGGPMSAFDRHIGHRQHFTVKSLTQLCQDAGLEVDEVSGAGFPFFNLYRSLVIARGEQLVADATTQPAQGGSKAVWAAMSLFDALLRMNLPRSRLGWQMVAIAREPVE